MMQEPAVAAGNPRPETLPEQQHAATGLKIGQVIAKDAPIPKKDE